MITAKVSGIPDLKAALAGIPDKLRRGALRNALAAGARLIRDDAKRAAPVLMAPVRNATGALIRKPGTVRDAITVRTSKQARASGDVGVFVNVRPAKGAKYKTTTRKTILRGKVRSRVKVRDSQRGADSPNDPYYWRFLEFGTSRMGKRSFLSTAAQRLGAALDVFKARIVPQLQKLNGGKDVQL